MTAPARRYALLAAADALEADDLALRNVVADDGPDAPLTAAQVVAYLRVLVDIESTAERFWAKVARSGECLEWTSGRHSEGYGLFYVRQRTYLAHRIAYQLANGPIPEGLQLDHLCRNRACVNPDHLEPVTQRENTLRSPVAPSALNAVKTHCDYGHLFDEANTYVFKGSRNCRTCRRDAQRRCRARKRAASPNPLAEEASA